MGPFISLNWPLDDVEAGLAATSIGRALTRDARWRRQSTGDGFDLYTTARFPVSLRGHGNGGMVLGDLFDNAGQAAPQRVSLDADVRRAASELLRRYWGRYVAVFKDSDGAVAGALRDPAGAVECMVWRKASITVVASEFPSSLLRALGPRRGLSWSAVHRLAADPIFGSVEALIDGVTAVAPGALAQPLGAGFFSTQLWRPSELARTPVTDVRFAAKALRQRVETSIAAHAACAGPILAEVSGGLDSSIVASSLVRANAHVACWCNHVTPDPSGDERVFARALGAGLGFEVLERPRLPFVVDPKGVSRSQFGPRPSVTGLDVLYDDDMAALAQRTGAKALFTGLGGDGLFFLSAFPPIARDLMLRQGLPAMLSADFGALARRCRRSVWAMARLAAFPTQKAFNLEMPAWVSPIEGAEAAHPWVDDTGDLPPAKRRHIQEQVYAQLFSGTSIRGLTLDLVNPLMSQPVLELCLQVPVDVHVSGGRDRALARRAFQDRVPASILERRSKGELGAYYSEAIAPGLPDIREYLLGGLLMSHGVLVHDELEALLQESALAQHGGISAVLRALAIEAWVRRWNPICTN